MELVHVKTQKYLPQPWYLWEESQELVIQGMLENAIELRFTELLLRYNLNKPTFNSYC